MSKKSRKEKAKVIENADWGAWVLIIMVVLTGILAYFHKNIGEEWTKVLEIVGAPFALGVGFFAFDKGFEMLNDYKENKRKDEED